MPYYYGAKVYFNGGNPYNLAEFSTSTYKYVGVQYIYPVYALYLFKPMLLFDFQTAYFVWFALKVLILAFLLIFWRKYFLEDKRYELLFFVFAAFAFRETIIRDLYAGNVSLIEQLLIWLAAYYFIKKKPGQFTILIVASTLFKMTSIALLLLLLFDRDMRSMIFMFLGLGFFQILNIVSISSNVSYLTTIRQAAFYATIKSGYNNPSSFAFINYLTGKISNQAGQPIPHLDITIYILLVMFLLIATYQFIKKHNFQANRMEIIVGTFLIYSLISPRFKDYSYILLIMPALYVIRNAMSTMYTRAIAVLAICINFLPFQTLFVAFALFLTFIRFIYAHDKAQKYKPNTENIQTAIQ
jgi:hypothetical protein